MTRTHTVDGIPMPKVASIEAHRTLLEVWAISGKTVNIMEMVDSLRASGSELRPLNGGEAIAFSYSFAATPEEIESIFALRR